MSVLLHLICVPYRSTELFIFKYGGGQRGLYLDFDFTTKNKLEDKFKVASCEFKIKEAKFGLPGASSKWKLADKKKLNNLNPCTKYDVNLVIHNVATKKDFAYQNIVFTRLDLKAAKLELKVDKIESDSATLSWNIADATCITSYNLSIINSRNESVFENSSEKGGSVIATKLSACDVYTASAVAVSAWNKEVRSKSKTFVLKSQNDVENLKLTVDSVTSSSVALSWGSEICSLEFKLNLRNGGNKIVYTTNTFNNSTVINDLTSCTEYSVELIALDHAKLSLKAVNKTFVTHSTPIDKVDIAVIGSTVSITWKSPPKLDCIVNYNISYTIEDCNFVIDQNTSCGKSKIVDKSKGFASFSSLPLAERFLLDFYVNEVTSESGVASRAKTWKFNTVDYEKFFAQNINEFRVGTTELRLGWSVDNYFLKILKHFEVFFDGQVLKSERPAITLNVAACNKNYDVVIRCVSIDGLFGPNITYQTNLHDDDLQLSSLQNNIEYMQANESIIISWLPLKEEESCIAYYEIDFNEQSFKTEELQTEINEFAPCMTYEIDITPVSHQGRRGITAKYEFTTSELGENFRTSIEIFVNFVYFQRRSNPQNWCFLKLATKN